MSSLASSSFDSRFNLEFDVFLTICGRRKHYVVTNWEKGFGDAGLNLWIDDLEDEFPMDDIRISRMLGIVLTPEFLEFDLFLERLLNIRRCQKLLNKQVVVVFCGLSVEQFWEQLKSMDQTRLDAWNSEFDLESGRFIAEAASLLDSATTIAEVASLSDLGSCMWHDELLHDLPKHQVGLPLRVKELLTIVGLRHIFSNEAVIVEIRGDEGIGKTTIANAIYDRIGGNFEGKSFLSNIGDVWGKNLQKQLISDISEIEFDEIDVFSLDERMKQVLCGRRVLVVIDNAYSGFKLEKLFVNVKWCGKGSLIFIISNKATFDVSINISYGIKRLNSEESLELFCFHAFKEFSPSNDFEDFLDHVIEYCEGLPLALEVFGALLHNRTRAEWKNVMNNMARIPHGQIQKKLKISCDLLTDIQKDLFFNIACLYVGQSKHFVTQFLKGSRLPMEMEMSVLIERNLIKVMNEKLYVHDLLQEIAKEISPGKPKLKYKYDVFLSFRGDDTRKGFTSHLCAALRQVGIEAYIDEERMERGENISCSLFEAIESSRISIIIFSKNYAGSSWCLQELEKIMECYKTSYHDVLPIFFDVRPFEVRKQQNAFGQAWEQLVNRTSSSKQKRLIINLKKALGEVANLSGWDMHNYRTETEVIDEVIETITKKLGDNKCLFVTRHPVGLISRMQGIIQLLRSKSNDVIIAAIWGMGGIGKTTIAKSIYNEVGQCFEGKCFLANVREVWKQNNGQVYLQEQLLSDISKSRRRALPNVEMGKTILEEMFSKKKVFVVLDDVNHEDQLKALCGSREWFGKGSRIIITTRDERLLKILRVIHVYTIKELDNNEALELFSWHAFKQAIPKQDFTELSRRVVSYSGGLPLALEILGSYLFDKEIMIWESALEKLQRIPNDEIQEKLKISYDGLSDNTEKDVFLDICCFLVGREKSYAIKILNGCRLYAEIGINRLIELSLVKVGNRNKLEMHDLLRDMGREIIRQLSPDEPGSRTRLWDHDDVVDVLKNSTGTKAIKGLALNMSQNNSVSYSAKAFKKMKRLYLLQLNHVQLVGDYNYLSTELRWLCWHGFTLKNIPMNLCLQKTIAIDLKWSNLTKVWEKCQLLEELKILNLSHCHYLTKTPEFSKLPHLEKLVLKDCSCLSIIHPSIGDLRYIILLNLKDCKSLRHLPRSVYKLKSLKTLNLCGCLKIEKLEEDIGQMESLTTLAANQIAIAQVPFSLVRLKRLKHVSLCGYEGLSRDVFPSLILSWMSPTYRSRSLFRAFQILPSLIKGLSHPLFSRRYEISKARPSTSQASCQNSPALLEFDEQVQVESSESLVSSLTIQVGLCNKVMDILLKSISKGWNDGGLDFSLPIENYSEDWLVFVNEGSSVSFKVPQVVGRHLRGVVLYIIYSSLQNSMASVHSVGIMIKNFTKDTMYFYNRKVATTSADEEWQNIVSNLEPGNDVEVEIKFANKHIVMKKIAIYLVYAEETDKLITFK